MGAQVVVYVYSLIIRYEATPILRYKRPDEPEEPEYIQNCSELGRAGLLNSVESLVVLPSLSNQFVSL